jgi:hypothetical protein
MSRRRFITTRVEEGHTREEAGLEGRGPLDRGMPCSLSTYTGWQMAAEEAQHKLMSGVLD